MDDTDDTCEKEADWRESKLSEEIHSNDFGFSESNDKREDTEAPKYAWYKITNTGNSDLLLYVVDSARAKYTNYAPLIGLSRLRMGSDGKGIRTLVAFHDCELNCKYCINPQCKILNAGNKVKYVSSE